MGRRSRLTLMADGEISSSMERWSPSTAVELKISSERLVLLSCGLRMSSMLMLRSGQTAADGDDAEAGRQMKSIEPLGLTRAGRTR